MDEIRTPTAALPLARPTLRDVAARAGVSTAAVSQALNERGALRAETRERILAVAAELGYAPDRYAAALRRGRTMSIGYMAEPVPAGEREASAATYGMRQLTALVGAAAAHGFTVAVLPHDRPELLRSARVDALYLPDARPGDAAITVAASIGIPVITNDLPVEFGAALSIRTGYQEATDACLELLTHTGARRIGLLTEEPSAPRLGIGEQVYRAWCVRRGQEPIVVQVREPGQLPRHARELLAADVDAVFSFYPHGPAVLVELEASRLVIPRDLQVAVLCLHDCAANARLGITHACVHPETAPALLLPRLTGLLCGEADGPATVALPWELNRGSTTR